MNIIICIFFNKIDLILNKDYLVLDYHDLYFNNETNFYDMSHLNYKGSEDLSKRVYEDIRQLVKD